MKTMVITMVLLLTGCPYVTVSGNQIAECAAACEKTHQRMARVTNAECVCEAGVTPAKVPEASDGGAR